MINKIINIFYNSADLADEETVDYSFKVNKQFNKDKNIFYKEIINNYKI